MGNRFSNFKEREWVEEIKEKVKEIPKEEKENITNMYDKYSQFSSDELLSEFIKTSKQRRADGTLNDSELARMKETLLPFLSEEQKGRLNQLLDLIR